MAAGFVRGPMTLPGRHELSPEEFEQRHRVVTTIVLLHVPALLAIAVARDFAVVPAVAEVAPVLVLAGVGARVSRLSRDARAAVASLALLLCGAILVHLTGGLTEAHFHFFVALPIVAVYQRWHLFVAAVVLVPVHHVLLGVIEPQWVFDHDSAHASPLLWSAVHAAFMLVLALVTAHVWHARDAAHDRSEQLRQELSAQTFRRRQALEINDSIVQGLATARYALELGEHELAVRSMEHTLGAARGLISDLVGAHALGVPESLVRNHAAQVVVGQPASRAVMRADLERERAKGAA